MKDAQPSAAPVRDRAPDVPAPKGRLFEIDFLRCLAMVWIVCIWHLRPLPAAWLHGTFYAVMDGITQICLGAFMFSSGFCLVSGRRFDSARGIVAFYGKRILRIVPLLVIAILTFPDLPSHHPHLAQLFACLGLSSYIPTTVADRMFTVWFASMLLSFYLILPLLSAKRHPVAAAAFLLLFCAGTWLLGWDERLLAMFPAFYLGILVSKAGPRRLFRLSAICAPVAILLLVLPWHNLPRNIGLAIVGFSLFILPGRLLARLGLLHPVFRWGAYVSFCAYLFHRHFFALYLPLLGPASSPQLRSVQHLLITFPLLFIVAFLIQKAYDMALKPFSRKTA